MIYLFHGDNNLFSRNGYFEILEKLKKQYPLAEVINLNGERITEAELIQALESKSILGDGRIIKIEGLFSRRKSGIKNKLIKRLTAVATDKINEIKLVCWEPKKISVREMAGINKIKNIRIREFSPSKYLFKFLDSLRPGNGKNASNLLKLTLENNHESLVLFMLGRRIAEIILAGEGRDNLSGIGSDWQKNNLLRQAEKWSVQKALEFHRSLIGIDEAVKTGSTPADLATHLDILVASL